MFAAQLKCRTLGWADRGRAFSRLRRERSTFASVTTEVSSDDALSDLSYHQQGAAELNTGAALLARQKLRRNLLINRALERWWAGALGMARHSRQSATSLESSDYVDIYRLLYRELLGDDGYDEAEADSSALEEWHSGSRRRTMERAAFADGMFELADVYTDR